MNLAHTPQRLDSWKTIAAYLGRDERTVRRWERDGLPVRRVPGGPGRSVFAYVDEVDAWLKTTRDAAPAETVAAPDPETTDREPSTTRRRRHRVLALGLASCGVALALVAWRTQARGATPVRYLVSSTDVRGVDATGGELWRYPLPASEVSLVSPEPLVPADAASRGAYVLVNGRLGRSDSAALGGRLLWLGPDGRSRGLFSLTDDLRFLQVTYGAPWTMVDARLDDRGDKSRVAVVAHHQTWWPGVLTVVDAKLRRVHTFVNAGWLEYVRWLAPDRLAVSGFSNARDGGMVALVDPNAPDDQSPPAGDIAFHCDSCGTGAPIRYVILPRSELNRVTGAPFNRARLDVSGDRITVRTEEVVTDSTIVDAVYDFTKNLTLVRASYSDKYWDLHRALEAQGRIGHSRADCPDRDGPREIQVWDAASGWHAVSRAHPR